MKLFKLLLILPFLLAITLFTYKFFEYQILKSLLELYRETSTQEISMSAQTNQIEESWNKASIELYTDYYSTFDDIINQYDNVLGLMTQSINNAENENKIQEKNNQKYQQFVSKTKFLLGSRKKFAQELLTNKQNFYQNDIALTNDIILAKKLWFHIDTVLRDLTLAQNYESQARYSKTKYQNLFYTIATLEKYSRDDFKFADQDKIHQQLPYGYEILQSLKQYLGSYYLFIKDFLATSNQSLPSHNPSYAKLEKEAPNINPDLEKIALEMQTTQESKNQQRLQAQVNALSTIKDFEENHLGYYPFLPPLTNWKEDLTLCHTYYRKTLLYLGIRRQDPQANTFPELLTELSQLYPKTNNLDNKFDESVIEFTNSPTTLRLTCKDKESDKNYLFQTTKK